MDPHLLRYSSNTEADRLLDQLLQWQHMDPRQSVEVMLQRAVQTIGICPLAVERATQWLAIDPTRAIGRLRRTELTQLARSLHRFWQANEKPQSANWQS